PAINDLKTALRVPGSFGWRKGASCSDDGLGRFYRGLKCDENGNLIAIDIHWGLLVSRISTLPPTISALTSLTEITLSSAYIFSRLDVFAKPLACLPNLQSLDLSWNSLYGPIPTYLINHATLTKLWLFDNKLTGPIPPYSPRLSSLLLFKNFLTGVFPLPASPEPDPLATAPSPAPAPAPTAGPSSSLPAPSPSAPPHSSSASSPPPPPPPFPSPPPPSPPPPVPPQCDVSGNCLSYTGKYTGACKGLPRSFMVQRNPIFCGAAVCGGNLTKCEADGKACMPMYSQWPPSSVQPLDLAPNRGWICDGCEWGLTAVKGTTSCVACNQTTGAAFYNSVTQLVCLGYHTAVAQP
ncbi:unnamed protein product, partial [Closterium sp. NIES-54]